MTILAMIPATHFDGALDMYPRWFLRLENSFPILQFDGSDVLMGESAQMPLQSLAAWRKGRVPPAAKAALYASCRLGDGFCLHHSYPRPRHGMQLGSVIVAVSF